MMILTVPISLTLSPYTRFYELRNKWLTEICFSDISVIMCPEPVPQATASPETHCEG